MRSTEGFLSIARGIDSVLLALLFVATSVHLGNAQGDPLTGTWKLNLGKSKYSPGPPPSSETVTYESAGQVLNYKVTQTDVKGMAAHLEGSLVYDGKDYPAKGTEDYDTVATKKIDAYTGETARKKSGNVVQTVIRVRSKDGKTLTLTTKGVNARGESIYNVAVYERQ